MNNLLKLFPVKGMTGPGGWTPNTKSGLVSWFRADSVILSGSNVLSWTDKSGNGRTATSAGSSPATWNSAALNGNPTVTFIGGATPPYYTFGGATPLLPIASAGSVVLVVKSAGVPASGFGVMLSLISDGSGSWCSFFTSNQTGYGLYTIGGGSTSSLNINNSFDPSVAWSGLVQNYNGGGAFDSATNWTVLANNASQTMSNGTGGVLTLSSVNSYLGAYVSGTLLPFAGDIAEVIVWNSILSGGDLSSLHTYLNTRYGIGVG